MRDQNKFLWLKESERLTLEYFEAEIHKKKVKLFKRATGTMPAALDNKLSGFSKAKPSGTNYNV
jgi:hypothetical protein